VVTEYSTRTKLNAFFEYWFMANEMKRLWFEDFPAGVEGIDSLEDATAVARRATLQMRLWYSCLFVVVEGYQELTDSGDLTRSDDVDELLEDSEGVDGLRLLRNSTFHFQPSWGHQKFFAFFHGQGRAQWIRTLHKRLGAVAIQAEMGSKEHETARLEELNVLLADNEESA